MFLVELTNLKDEIDGQLRFANILERIIKKQMQSSVVMNEFELAVCGADPLEYKLQDSVVQIEGVFSALKLQTQILELGCVIVVGIYSYELVIRDGADYNVHSNDHEILKENIIGSFKFLDPSLFYPPNTILNPN